MQIKIYGTESCNFCYKARELAANHGLEFEYYDIGRGSKLVEFGNLFPQAKTVPQITVNGAWVGGYEAFKKFLEEAP